MSAPGTAQPLTDEAFLAEHDRMHRLAQVDGHASIAFSLWLASLSIEEMKRLAALVNRRRLEGGSV